MKNLFCILALLFACPTITLATPQNGQIFFHANKAQAQLETVAKDLAEPSVPLATYIGSVNALDTLRDQSKSCIESADAKVSQLNILLKSMKVEHVALTEQADLKYLQAKKLFYAKQLSDCRFFYYRSGEALTAYRNEIQKRSASRIFKKSIPLWKINKTNANEIYQNLVHKNNFVRLVFALGLFLLGLLLIKQYLFKSIKSVRKFIPNKSFVISVVSVAVLIAVSGYYQLALFLLQALLFTYLLILVSLVLYQLIAVYFNKIHSHAGVRVLLGLKPHRQAVEFNLIKTVIYFSYLCFFIVAVMTIWNLSSNWIDVFTDSIFDGFHFSGLLIIPYKILLALISFSIILMLGRIIASAISRGHKFEGEEETQIALSSIIIYLSFGMALIFALLITGADFTSLAIIAGALSVGIGLGLQNIVNNFVSGLILLLEKPIKPGDRIIVGNTEGFVKKIRVRSTQIQTMSKEDVIVPNADLISNQVTNYMFRDRHWRVVCQVGVAYGSDVDLVKSVLLDVASQHEDVLKNKPNEPAVLFKEFGDSSLVLELWCIIQDVNKKYQIQSELNFSIDKSFRENNITIAFPQTDIHIKT